MRGEAVKLPEFSDALGVAEFPELNGPDNPEKEIEVVPIRLKTNASLGLLALLKKTPDANCTWIFRLLPSFVAVTVPYDESVPQQEAFVVRS